MKYLLRLRHTEPDQSPSMRREWIEIEIRTVEKNGEPSPSMRREWIEIRKLKAIRIVQSRLPPCGGSGLKSVMSLNFSALSFSSPSMRREWIEIHGNFNTGQNHNVSLHAEGVD